MINHLPTPHLYQQLVQHFGGQVKTADALGVSQAAVSGYVNGKWSMSAVAAMRAEWLTQGQWQASDLCPALRQLAGVCVDGADRIEHVDRVERVDTARSIAHASQSLSAAQPISTPLPQPISFSGIGTTTQATGNKKAFTASSKGF